MKSKLFFLLYLIFSSLFLFAQKEENVDENFHVYLLIGQSNMAGRGAIDSVINKNTNILVLDSLNNWVVAQDPLHFDNLKLIGVGPGLSFAQEMIKDKPNVKIGLIPCALGGSPIKVWQPNAMYLKKFYPYDDAIKRTKIAMQKGVLKGVLWHQGESDNDSLKSSRYLPALTSLIMKIRTDLNAPKLPFLLGEIGHFNKNNFINPLLLDIPKAISFTSVVSAKDLNHKGDTLHFDTNSARELGKRFAVELKKINSE